MSDVEVNNSEETEGALEATEVTEDVEETEDTEQPDEAFDADKAREKIRKVNSENRTLRERAKNAEAKAKGAEDSGKRVSELEAENMRLRVAAKLGGQLPDDLIDRLRGNTEEELLEDAEKLLGHFERKKPPTQQPRENLRGGGGQDIEPDETADLDKFAASIFKN